MLQLKEIVEVIRYSLPICLPRIEGREYLHPHQPLLGTFQFSLKEIIDIIPSAG